MRCFLWQLLFQRFVEGKTPLADFLDSFLGSQKLQHIRLLLAKKVREMIELKSAQRLSEIQNACLPACGLTTAVFLPACCHPPLLLPFGAHVNAAQCLQGSPFCHDYSESPRPGAHRRVSRWPPKPVRLQPLKVQQRRHQQAPQWSPTQTQMHVLQSGNSHWVEFPQSSIENCPVSKYVQIENLILIYFLIRC